MYRCQPYPQDKWSIRHIHFSKSMHRWYCAGIHTQRDVRHQQNKAYHHIIKWKFFSSAFDFKLLRKMFFNLKKESHSSFLDSYPSVLDNNSLMVDILLFQTTSKAVFSSLLNNQPDIGFSISLWRHRTSQFHALGCAIRFREDLWNQYPHAPQ